MKLWSIEGNTQRLDGGSMFGNAPRALWSKWMEPDAANRIPLATRALLATPLNGRTVLFETGIGAFFEARLRERYAIGGDGHVLLESLRDAGFGHEDIDVVVLSHLHFDHAGGLLSAWEQDKAPELLFPNATFVIGREQWERARDPHPRDRASYIPELIPLLEASGRVELVEPGSERSPALGDAVRFHWSHGHTPGMMLSEVLGPEQREDGHHGGVVFCADLVPGLPWVHVPITMGYDRCAETLIDEKQAFLEDKLARGVHLFFTHDPGCALALPGRDERGRFAGLHQVERLQARPLGG